ncbi:MFS transporter, partial [Streptosporangium sandarakinum]|uniref:MFS transporter n=1 Tax=Streptosporangium sandarakinum TaxID=1260955 RepID=UPI0033B4D9C0
MAIAAPGRAPDTAPAPGPTLALACAAPLLTLIDYTVPMTTLPQMARDLGSGPAGPAWLLNGISLGLAAALLVTGDAADAYGRRRVYLAGLWTLAATAVVAGLSTGTGMFVAARVAQGAAGAAVLTAGLGVLGHAFPTGPGRLRATGRYGAMIGLGIAVGPLLSGALAAAVSWRAVHWAVAVAAAALALTAARRLPE